MHLNESPYSPPDFIIENIEKYLTKGNRYQHPDLIARLRELAAEYSRVEPNNILPTPGGDGALRTIFYNLTQPNDTIVYNYPSYSMYPVYSSIRGLNVIKINLRENGDWWEENLDSLYDKISNARLVIIDDPNNPTGSPMLKAKEDIISNIAKKINGLLLIDEAYYEFSGYTVKDFINKYKNVAIVRTLSKAFSLASFRVGYLIADKEVIKALTKATTPFDIPLPSLVAGISALENPSYAFNIANEIKKNRDFLYESMKKLGLKVYKSLTNFLYFKYNGDLIHPLLSRGIAIRRPIDGHYRVTVGTLDQCTIFIKRLGEIIENSDTK